MFAKFLKDESGATAIEYGILAAAIGLAILAGASFLGTELNSFFSAVGNKLKAEAPKTS